MSSIVKILIGDSTPEFGRSMAGALSDSGFVVKNCDSDGTAVMDSIAEFAPDVVICDALMPNADAVEIIRRLSRNSRPPFFIVLSSYRNSFIEREILSCSNAYLLIRPVDAEAIINLVRHTTPDYISSAENDPAQIEKVVTDIIHQIGIPAHIKGYHYLRKAILLAIDDQDMLESVTKMLYPAVAAEFDTSPSRVERAIRHAIETAWDRGDVEILNSMFGYTINGGKGKPTNSEFIALITDDLRLRFRITPKSEHKSEHNKTTISS
ncbi:MAG: sporulation transcription factor Spo0A [Oscillospiraceae bacterium]|nr:sporulation transcription factor Spo0A [Oscillospiraceae bacterium]